MIHRSVTALVLAACTFAPLASYAAVHSDANNANVAQAKGPMVKVTLKNRGTEEQNLVVDGRAITIQPNADYALAVPAGTQVMGADNTVKVTVDKAYNGATISLR